MKSFGLTDKGAVRKDNQDSFIIEKCDAADCTIFAVCDGMGGANAGELASQISNKAFVSYIYERLTARGRKKTDIPQMLTDACKEANGVSYEYSMFDETCRGMGSTIVGGVIKNNGSGYIVNVGDSRAYLISRNAGTIKQITKDHSLVQEMVEAGMITKEQAKNHPQKNIITRAVGSEATVKADLFPVSIDAGDVLLLCSDGLTNTVADEEILLAAKENRSPDELCRFLMKKALNRRAKDNVTIVAMTR